MILIQIALDILSFFGSFVILHNAHHRDWHCFVYFGLAVAGLAHTLSQQDSLGQIMWITHVLGWVIVLSKSIDSIRRNRDAKPHPRTH